MLHSEEMKRVLAWFDPELPPRLWLPQAGVFVAGLPLLCAIGCLLTAIATAAVDRNLAPDLRRAPAMVRAA